ncbi:MAG TPA: hypothetical protein VFJ58_05770 [Armatimonadota bacterium]|nr:hypothetical protein [Armatimonadota bacterium]
MRTQVFKRMAVISAIALSLGGFVAASSQGQGGPPPGGGFQQGGGPGGPPFGGGRFGGGRFGGPGMFPGGGPESLTATTTNVYILRGGTLYSYDAHTLKLIGAAQLPAPQPPAAQTQPGQ